MLLMEHNQNTIAAINHQRPIRIKFQDHSRLFHQSLRREKTGLCRKVIFWQSGARFRGRCRFLEV